MRADDTEDAILMINHMGFGDKLGEWLIGKVSEEERRDRAKRLKECCSMLRLYGSEGEEVKDIMEAYSPPRVTAMADKMCMILGLSMDLTTIDQ